MGIEVHDPRLPDGVLEVDTDDPKLASQAAQKFLAKQPKFDTAASDPLARSMPMPIMNRRAPVTTRNAVNMTPVLNNGQGATAAQQGDYVKGAAETVPGWVGGVPGNVEALARLPLAMAGVASPKTALPTSSEVTDSLFGQPKNDMQSGGRRLGDLLGAIAAPTVIAKGAQGIGKAAGFLGKQAFGLSTGAGPAALSEAYSAGKEGGDAAETFVANMRDQAPISDVVDSAKAAVAQMGANRSAAYRAGIGATIKGDPQVLDVKPILDAVNDAAGVGTFKGQSLSAGAAKVLDKINQTVSEWAQLDPAEYHTPEGIDALKQKIGNLAFEDDLKSLTQPRSPGKAIVDRVYNAIKGQITDQVPGYADVMKDYHDASEELRNVENGLSLGSKANVDTSLRKLQSLMRDNVNTNFGARTAMGQTLVDNGASDLMPALAGQSLKSWTPRGIGRALAGTEIGVAALHPASWPTLATALAASSPRLVGEAAHGLGKLSNAVEPLMSGGNAAILSVPSIAANPHIRALMLARALSMSSPQVPVPASVP